MSLIHNLLLYINESIHKIFHTTAGIDYPHGHWVLTAFVIIAFIVAPCSLLFFILRYVVRGVSNIRKRRSRLTAIVKKGNFNGSIIKAPDDEKAHLLKIGSIPATAIDPWILVTFILKTTTNIQIKLIFLSLMTLPAAWLLLDIPKHIINNALSNMPSDRGMTLLSVRFEGIQLLIALCTSYFIILTLSGIIKFLANQVRGHVNERIVRRLRLQIVRKSRIVANNGTSTDLSAVAVQEVEPIGYFGSSMFVVPLIHGGTLIISVTFLFVQNPAFALSALVMLPVQILILPFMQKQLNLIVRKRVFVTRQISAMITNNSLLQTDDRQNKIQNEPLSYQHYRVRTLANIRIEINDLKGKMKGIYNYTSSLAPFFLFAIGGYLVVQGQLSLGALVAALAAYREIAPALRELFDFAQNWSDASARFDEITRVLAKTDSNR